MASPTISSVTGAVVTGTGFVDYLKTHWLFLASLRGGLTSEIGGVTMVNTNSTPLTSNKDWYGGGSYFDGTAYINAGNFSSISTELSFACLFRTNDTKNQYIVSHMKRVSGVDLGFAIAMNTGIISLYISDGTDAALWNASGTYNDNNFYSLRISADRTGGTWVTKIWINDSLVNNNSLSGGTASTGSIVNSNVDLIIGGRFEPAVQPEIWRTFVGSIGMVQLSDQALTDPQGESLYEASHFAINEAYNLATVDSSAQSTLTSEPTIGDTVYAYNHEGSASYTIPASSASTIKQIFSF